jgi:lysyl-tRNA synthetase, class II
VISLAERARDRVPALAGLATAFVGLVNIGSALTPELPLRLRSLLALAPATDVRLAHALALPAGLALLGVAWPIARRRRRALHLAVVLLIAAGALNVLKGLDLEEALISWALAYGLWRARPAFWVRHASDALPQLLARCAAIAAAAVGTALLAVTVAGAPPSAALRGLVLSGPGQFDEHFGWLPLALALLGIGSAVVIGALLLAPLRPQRVADALDRRRAAALVRRHGTDTLSAFKLRDDLVRRWSPDGRTLVAYRIHAGTLLLAGDPVGPAETYEPMLREMRCYARDHGLALGILGASETCMEAARRAGLRHLYLGDEAMVRAGEMDLSGGSRKSLRKAVNRVARNGYAAELVTVADLTPAVQAELERVSEHWRDGAEERGFSMAHHTLVDELLPDALVLIARDDGGTVRGFLHFVPVCGARQVSLGFMRRERDTPNGLTEFMVVAAARLLGERGIEEFSLNFNAGGRWLREPANIVERAAAGTLRIADRWLQIERLLRFNQKFEPRWQPRYLVFERVTDVPRVALGAMVAEGQVPTPAPLRRLGPSPSPS